MGNGDRLSGNHRRWTARAGDGADCSPGRPRRRDRQQPRPGNLNCNGQVVIDATNDWAADDLNGRTSSEIVAGLVAGARVVKAANTLGAEVLGSDPHEAGGQRVIFVSGDDADAKAEVVALFQEAGFAAIDLGDLATGGEMQQIHHPLAGVNLIRL